MRFLVYFFLFASGCCALIYQIAWIRILTVAFGTTVYAVSTVLTVFMLGLAIGSYVFGSLADSSKAPLRLYALVEISLGVYAVAFALVSPHFPEWTARLFRGSELSQDPVNLANFVAALVVLLLPCILMGGTLPIVAKFVTESMESLGVRVAVLYGFNTLGAVVGCYFEAFVLIRTIGVQSSILLAAAINIAIGACCFLLRPSPSTCADHDMERVADSPATRSVSESDIVSPWLVRGIAFASGAITLATEVLWTRLMINFFTGNALVFATILAGFLTGISLASFLVSRIANRIRRLHHFLAALLIAGNMCLILSVAGQAMLATWLSGVRNAPESGLFNGAEWCLIILFLLVTGTVTVLGAVFPLLFRWSAQSLSRLGNQLGALYAFNTLGSLVGSFVAGFVFLKLLGVNRSLVLLALVYAVLALAVSRRKLVRLATGAVCLVSLVLFFHSDFCRPVYWFNAGFNTIQKISPDDTLYLEEGVEATVGVAKFGSSIGLTVNGIIVAQSTFSDLWDLQLKAHLPMLIHEAPRRVALVGLGGGVSLGTVLAYDVLQRVDCIEISKAVVPAHKYFEAFNNRCWTDGRLNLWINDGRHFLLTTEQRYDVISVDPTDPPICNQYTQDFFQLCHDRLDDGGLMVQWVPLFRITPLHIRIIMRAFKNVFPESTLWYDGTSVLLIGRRGGPLEIDFARFLRRAKEPRVQRMLAQIGAPTGEMLLATFLCGPDELDRLIGTNVPPNTDDLPFLEYTVLLGDRRDPRTLAQNLEILIRHYEPIDKLLAHSQTRADLHEYHRLREAMKMLMQVRIHARRRNRPEWEKLIREVIVDYDLQPEELSTLQVFYR